MHQIQTADARVWGSSDVNQTTLVLCFFTSGCCSFSLPVAINRASGPDGFIPCVPGQALQTLWLCHCCEERGRLRVRGQGVGWACHVGLSTLSRGGRTAGIVASSSRVWGWRVLLSFRSSPSLDKLLPAADSFWQACSSVPVLTCRHDLLFL